MNDSTLAEQIRELVDAVEPMTLEDITAPGLARSTRRPRRTIALAAAMSLFLAVVTVGVVALARDAKDGRQVSVSPGAAPSSREASVRELQPGGADALVAMDDDASQDQIDDVRNALSQIAAVKRFSVFDRRTIRHEAKQLLDGGTTLDDAPKVEPPPPFLVVELVHGATNSWSRRVDRLPGVARTVRPSDGSGDPIGTYAQCVSYAANGWTTEVFMKVDAPAGQIAAVSAALDANPAVRKFAFVDKAAAFEEFRRIFRGKPDLVNSIAPADLPPSFRIAVRRSERQTAKATFEALDGVDAVEEPSTHACEDAYFRR